MFKYSNANLFTYFAKKLVFGNVESTSPTLQFGTAAPVSGTYQQGSLVFSQSPTAGTFLVFRCVVSGTPGTWETVASAAPSQYSQVYPRNWTTTQVGVLNRSLIQTFRAPAAMSLSALNINITVANGADSWQMGVYSRAAGNIISASSTLLASTAAFVPALGVNQVALSSPLDLTAGAEYCACIKFLTNAGSTLATNSVVSDNTGYAFRDLAGGLETNLSGFSAANIAWPLGLQG